MSMMSYTPDTRNGTGIYATPCAGNQAYIPVPFVVVWVPHSHQVHWLVRRRERARQGARFRGYAHETGS